MQIEKQLDGSTLRLGLGGELTIYSAGELQAVLLASLHESEAIELELAAVTELDSAGFQLLYLLAREGHAARKPVRVCSHSPATREVFDLYRAHGHFAAPEPT